MAERKERPLFSVTKVTKGEETWLEVDWPDPELSDALEWMSPNGHLTDRLINMAEEMLQDIEEEKQESLTAALTDEVRG